MKFDLKDFKKLHSTGSHTVFQHPDGHEIKISHAAISPKHRSELHSLDVRKMDEGGKVGAKAPTPKPPQNPAESLTKSFMNATGSEGIKQAKTNVQNYAEGDLVEEPSGPVQAMRAGAVGGGQELVGEAPQVDLGEAPPQSGILSSANASASPMNQGLQNAPIPVSPQGSQGDIYGNEEYLKNTQKGIELQEKGYREEAQAAQAAGQAEAKAHQEALGQQQNTLNEFHKNVQQINNDISSATEDYKNQHINPNHYFQSMDTWGRISTALGLIVGGLGGPDNAASKFLNDQINRDIKAQEAEMGKKENLLSMNFKRYGNMRDAADMTRMMQMDMAAHTLGAARANAQGPMAQAKMDQEVGKLYDSKAAILSQMAARKALLGSGALNGVNGQRNLPAVINAVVTDPHQKAEAMKEAKEGELLGAAKKRAMEVFDQVVKINSMGNRLMNPIQAKKQVEALVKPLVLGMTKATAGRVAEYETTMLEPMFKELTDNQQTVDIKRKSLDNFFNEKAKFPVLEGYGLRVPGFNSVPSMNRNVRGRK